MSYISILRQLVDHLQYSELKAHAQGYYAETADIQVLPLIALAHAQLGEVQMATTLCQQAEECCSKLDQDALIDLAAVYCLMYRIEDAMGLLDAALLNRPNHSLALARLAWCHLQLGQNDLALKLYQHAAELAPERLPIWAALIPLSLKDVDIPTAQQALDTAISQLGILHAELPTTVFEVFTAQFRGLQLEIWLAANEIGQIEQWLDERRNRLEEKEWIGLVVIYATLLAGKDLHVEAENALHNAQGEYPDNQILTLQLAELIQLQGRTQQAIHLLRQAIARDEANPALWARLASANLNQSVDAARHAAEKSVTLASQLKPDEKPLHQSVDAMKLQAKLALAQVESMDQNYSLAEQLFNQILDLNPLSVPALRGLGHQHMQLGNIDEAIKLFEQVKQLDPVSGHTALINVRHFPDDEETLDKLEKAARTPSMEGAVRAGILIQLAAAWEKRKQYDKAMSFAQEANLINQRFLKYNPQAHRNQCARLRHNFCKALYEHRKDCGVASTLPVFVLGMPRSGTTLVEQIIASHSEIFGAGELGVIPGCIQGLNRWERHTGSGRRYPDCVDDLTPQVVAGIAKGILDELGEYAPDARHIVDKLPHNFEHIGLIKFLFPKARIISVRRDPRDIALSNFFTDYQAKHVGMGFAYDMTQIGEQLADHNLLMNHWQQIFPGEILEIHYEDLLDDLEKTARIMLDYIGVNWEPQVLDFNQLDRPIKTASVWQVRQPIYQTSKAKWLNYQNHLASLTKGTNSRINWDDFTSITLPEAGFLSIGIELFHAKDFDGAERSFKKMLHHNPDHAACNYMVGLIYLNKDHLFEGISLIEKALKRCPWQQEWRKNLLEAYLQTGQQDKAEKMRSKLQQNPVTEHEDPVDDDFTTHKIENSTYPMR